MTEPAAVVEDYDVDHAPEGTGVEQDRRAENHRRRALEAVDDLDLGVALVHALLALEARVEELTCYVAAR